MTRGWKLKFKSNQVGLLIILCIYTLTFLFFPFGFFKDFQIDWSDLENHIWQVLVLWLRPYLQAQIVVFVGKEFEEFAAEISTLFGMIGFFSTDYGTRQWSNMATTNRIQYELINLIIRKC